MDVPGPGTCCTQIVNGKERGRECRDNKAAKTAQSIVDRGTKAAQGKTREGGGGGRNSSSRRRRRTSGAEWVRECEEGNWIHKVSPPALTLAWVKSWQGVKEVLKSVGKKFLPKFRRHISEAKILKSGGKKWWFYSSIMHCNGTVKWE